MTRPITDSELYAAIDSAFDLWQSRYEGDLPAHTFSAGFEEKIAAIPGTVRPTARRPLRTAVAVAAIAATLTMTIGADVVPAAKTFRSGMVEVVSQLLPKSTDQTYTTDTDHEGETRRPVLNWLPEGMVETKRDEQFEYTHLNFNNKDKNRLTIFVQRIFTNSSPSTSIDTEDAHVETISIGENQAVVSIKDDTTIIEWCIDNYICSVIGTIPTEQVLKVAEHIELK